MWRILDAEKPQGAALKKAMLAKIRDKSMPDKDGNDIILYLDERAEFISEGDQQELNVRLSSR